MLKEEKATKKVPWSMKVDEKDKSNMASLSLERQKEARELLKEVYALLSDGEILTTTTVQMEYDLRYIESKLEDVEWQIQYHQERAVNLEQLKKEYMNKAQEIQSQIIEEIEREEERNSLLDAFVQDVIGKYLDTKNILECNSILEEYMEVCTNHECINALRTFVNANAGHEVQIQDKQILLDKSLRLDLLSLSDDMKT